MSEWEGGLTCKGKMHEEGMRPQGSMGTWCGQMTRNCQRPNLGGWSACQARLIAFCTAFFPILPSEMCNLYMWMSPLSGKVTSALAFAWAGNNFCQLPQQILEVYETKSGLRMFQVESGTDCYLHSNWKQYVNCLGTMFNICLDAWLLVYPQMVHS